VLGTYGRVVTSAHTIGLVGYGAWAVHILRDLRSLGCDVHVAARSEDGRRAAVEAGAAAAVSSPQELTNVAGIVVAVPTSVHGEAIRSSIAHGVPVFVEKPLTANAKEARELASAFDGRLFVMDKWRYHPGVEALAAIVRDGELGKPVGVRSVRRGWGHNHPDVDPVWTLAPHDLSIGLEILGRLPVPVAAVGEWVGPILWGVTAVLGTEPWLVIETTGASHVRRREVHLVCEHGIAWLSDPYAEAIGIAPSAALGDEPHWRPISTELPLLRELRAFVEHLGGGPPPRSSAAEGALVVERIAEIHALASGEAGG
jgi:predicted dehydrogenase